MAIYWIAFFLDVFRPRLYFFFQTVLISLFSSCLSKETRDGYTVGSIQKEFPYDVT